MLRFGSIKKTSYISSWLRIRPTATNNAHEFRYNAHSLSRREQHWLQSALPRPSSCALQYRFASHEAIEAAQNGLAGNEGLTDTILKSALGTLPSSQIDLSFELISFWLNSNSGFGIDSADRLLQRLVYEETAAPSRLRRHHTMLLFFHGKLLETWMKCGEYPMALDRAENILLRLIDWKNSGVAFELSTSEQFVRMVELLLSRQPHSGLSRATQLLLWWTQDLNSADSVDGALVPLFHRALDQSIAAQDRSLAMAVAGRMSDLQNCPQWNGIEPQSSVWSAINEMIPIGSQDDSVAITDNLTPRDGHGVMSAEGTVLRRLLFSYMETASLVDAEQVEEFAKNYQPWATTPESKHELHAAATTYYLRFGDQKGATRWIQGIDPSTCSDRAWLQRSLEQILHLWFNESSPEAPWRAHEILQRLEAIDAARTQTCSMVAEMWLASSDQSSERKVQHLVAKIVDSFPRGDPNPQLDLHTLRIMLKYPVPFLDVISLDDQANVFVENCGKFPKHLLPELTETLLRTLAKSGMSRMAREVVKQPSVSEILTASMCETVFYAHLNSRKPRITISLLEFFLRRHSHALSLRCYVVTAMALCRDMQPDSFEKITGIFNTVGDRIAKGDLPFETKEISTMISYVSERLSRAVRPEEADYVLRLAERLFLKAESRPDCDQELLSIQSYNQVLDAWLATGQSNKASKTLERVWALYRSGLSNMMPTTSTFASFLRFHSERRESKKVVGYFKELFQLYKETRNQACKPDAFTINMVMQALEAINAPPGKAWEIIEFMREIGLGVTIDNFNNLLTLVLNGDDPYRDVLNLVTRMDEFGLKPNWRTSIVILKACGMAKPRDREAALGTAVEFLGRARQQGQPLVDHYDSYFATIYRLLPPRDPRLEVLVKSAFQLCYSDGLHLKSMRNLKPLVSRNLWVQLNQQISNLSRIPMERSANDSVTMPTNDHRLGINEHAAEDEESVDVSYLDVALPARQDAAELLSYIGSLGIEGGLHNGEGVELPEELRESVERALEVLADRGMGEQAEHVLRQAMLHFNVSTNMCVNACKAHYKSDRAQNTVALVDSLDSQTVPLSFECYQLAMLALVKSGHEERHVKIGRWMTEVVKRANAGEIEVAEIEFKTLFTQLTEAYAKSNNPQELADVLFMTDELLSQYNEGLLSGETLFDLSVYRGCIDALVRVKEFDKVNKILDLVFRRCELIAPELLVQFLRSVVSQHFDHVVIPKDLFDRWIKLYKETNNDAYKPTQDDFRQLLHHCYKHPGESSTRQALQYLESWMQCGIHLDNNELDDFFLTLLVQEAHTNEPVSEYVHRMLSLGWIPNKQACDKIFELSLKVEPQHHAMALGTAMDVLSLLHKNGKSSEVLYQHFFQALRLLGEFDSRKDDMFERAFRMCWHDNYKSLVEREFKVKINPATWDRLTAESSSEEPLEDPSHRVQVEFQ